MNVTDEMTKQVMHECSKGSLEGTMAFPEVVARLTSVGCEQYHADFRRQEKTYYLPDGQNHIEAFPVDSRTVAESFSAENVIGAIHAIQNREISYREFLDRIVEAGCVGYFVYIAGKRAIYMGRNGDVHVEYFPTGGATRRD